LILLFLSCNQNEYSGIASVDSVQISSLEFEDRLNFNPFLTQIEDDEQTSKFVLSALIAEKVLLLEANQYYRIKSDSELDVLINQRKKEVMIEQIRRDSVESLIHIQTEDLEKEYDRALRQIEIEYVAVADKEEAELVRNQIDKPDDFYPVIRQYMENKGWGAEQIPTKIITWGKENLSLEDSIYRLGENEVSEPIPANGEYYIIKVDKISSTLKPANEDFERRLPALKDRVTRRKILDRYTQFYNRQISSLVGNIDAPKLIAILHNILINAISDWENINHGKLNQNQPWNDQLVLNNDQLNEKVMNETIIRFPDKVIWSFSDVLRNLKYGPYAFNYSNPDQFLKSVYMNTRLLAEHEAIYKRAVQLDYEKHQNVQDEYRMWAAYFRANKFRHQLLGKKENEWFSAGIDSSAFGLKRLEFLDVFLCEVVKKYSIKINQKKLRQVTVNRQNMVVVKSHFANRLVAPPLEVLTALPNWTKRMTEVFRRNNI
jgi:parvulin-like peptidyl-prolyl isomerase